MQGMHNIVAGKQPIIRWANKAVNSPPMRCISVTVPTTLSRPVEIHNTARLDHSIPRSAGGQAARATLARLSVYLASSINASCCAKKVDSTEMLQRLVMQLLTPSVPKSDCEWNINGFVAKFRAHIARMANWPE
ncbi:hypothetical protein F4811DRAFT_95675 [Daldinia bambusicola]|nr:hypothetical protein F4811DRAFT_95675 [Daldinia bambusicola]